MSHSKTPVGGLFRIEIFEYGNTRGFSTRVYPKIFGVIIQLRASRF